MNEIEKRAKTNANAYLDVRFEKKKHTTVREDFANGYIQGATEQRAIDIDNACEWLRWIMKNGSSYGEFPSEESIKDFRKAMEE